MKTRTFVSTLILVLAVLIVVGSCATKKEVVTEKEFYVPKFDEEIHGTWMNEEYDSAAYPGKIRMHNWGYYEHITPSDSEVVQFKGTIVIVDKWTDSEGNIWYKTMLRAYGGTVNWFHLDKISNNGNIWEFVRTTVDFPTESDMHPDFQLYHIYYRQE